MCIRDRPIGNLTSQFWANCYLNEFDHFVTRELGCPAYLRFVDDFLLFADDKRTLWAWKQAVKARLAALRLTLHEGSAQVRPTTEGVRFLGFVVFPTHRRLLRRKGIHYWRRFHHLLTDYRSQRAKRPRLDASLRGWVNHVRYTNTCRPRRALVQGVRL